MSKGIWIDDPFGSAQDRFSIDYLRFSFYYFGAVSLGKCLQTGRRVVYLTGQPRSVAGEENG